MTRIKPAEVRFYLDANLLGLAAILTRVRVDVTFPGDAGGVLYKRERPSCPIKSTAVLDRDWIPEVATRGWLILTRDRRIRDHKLELAAVQQYGARLVAFTGDETSTVWGQLEAVMCRWRDIERCLDEQPPFIYAASRSRLRKIPLDD
jgi:hypothetical protein